jgi:hypothetical protein
MARRTNEYAINRLRSVYRRQYTQRTMTSVPSCFTLARSIVAVPVRRAASVADDVVAGCSRPAAVADAPLVFAPPVNAFDAAYFYEEHLHFEVESISYSRAVDCAVFEHAIVANINMVRRMRINKQADKHVADANFAKTL